MIVLIETLCNILIDQESGSNPPYMFSALALPNSTEYFEGTHTI